MRIKDLCILKKNEKMFDKTVCNGGLTSILMNVCVIGDSLSSGETELKHKDGSRTYHDKFEFSWGQFLARDAGINVINMSHGGQTAANLLKEDKEGANYFSKKYYANAYIIALGVNDVINNRMDIGNVNDMNNKSSKSFAHYYGIIIKKIQKLNPNARFFFVSMPNTICDDKATSNIRKEHAKLLKEFSKVIPHSFILDLYNDAPKYKKDFFYLYFFNGHLNAAGYRFTATLIESGIDYIIRHNMGEFREAGLMGYPEYDEELSYE